MTPINPDVALFAGDPLNPRKIGDNFQATRVAGWTTILLGLFHVGDGISTIYFNDLPVIVDREVTDIFKDWQHPLSELLQGGTVRRLYASIGGGAPVKDFTTIEKVYKDNCNSFKNTLLQFNLKKFHEAFPAITGIDMDVEDNYDEESFVAFCKLVHDLGFEISFCPFGYETDTNFQFWIESLQKIEQSDWGKGAVKRFNLQCYADENSPPQDWAAAIKRVMPNFNTDGFINVGGWARFKDDGGDWDKQCPVDLQDYIAAYKTGGQGSVGGAFIWNMDYILETSLDPTGCNGYAFMGDYTTAILNALSSS